MRKRFLLFVIGILCICSTIAFFLTIFYIDPLVNSVLALFIILFSFFSAVSSFLTLVLYFIKKIYFRGEVYIFHVLTSFRQGSLISFFLIGCLFFTSFGIINGWTVFALWMFFGLIELFIRNITLKE